MQRFLLIALLVISFMTSQRCRDVLWALAPHTTLDHVNELTGQRDDLPPPPLESHRFRGTYRPQWLLEQLAISVFLEKKGQAIAGPVLLTRIEQKIT